MRHEIFEFPEFSFGAERAFIRGLQIVINSASVFPSDPCQFLRHVHVRRGHHRSFKVIS